MIHHKRFRQQLIKIRTEIVSTAPPLDLIITSLHFIARLRTPTTRSQVMLMPAITTLSQNSSIVLHYVNTIMTSSLCAHKIIQAITYALAYLELLH